MCCCPDEYFVEEVMEEVVEEVVEERTVQVVHVYLNTWLV